MQVTLVLCSIVSSSFRFFPPNSALTFQQDQQTHGALRCYRAQNLRCKTVGTVVKTVPLSRFTGVSVAVLDCF